MNLIAQIYKKTLEESSIFRLFEDSTLIAEIPLEDAGDTVDLSHADFMLKKLGWCKDGKWKYIKGWPGWEATIKRLPLRDKKQ